MSRYLIFIYILIGNLLVAQDFSYRQYTVNEGLPSNETYGILEDRSGLIWIGTGHGVNRFNGHEFETYTTSDGLPDNTIFDFYEDYAGRIWFFTFNGEIGYYHDNSFYPMDVGSLNRIRAISVDKNDYVSIEFFSSETLVRFRLDNNKIDSSTLVREKKNNRVPFFKNGKTLKMIQIDSNTICHADLYDIQILDSNFNVNHHFKVPKELGSIIGIGQTKNHLFVSLSTNKLLQYDLNTYVFINEHDMGPFKISSVFEDQFNGVWLSTLNSGILYVPNFQMKVKNLNRSSSSPYFFNKSKDFTTIVYTDNSIQTYSTDGDIVNSTHINGTLENIRKENDHIYISAQQEFLKLNDAGQEIYRDNFKKKEHYNRSNVNLSGFYDGVIAQDGKLYSCSNDIIYMDTMVIPIKGSRRLVTLAEQGDTLWAGGLNGLFAISKKTKKQLKISTDPLLSNRVNKLKSRNSDLYITTRGGGLIIIHNNKIYQIKEKDGLISNSTKQVEIKDSIIWVTSNSGVSKIQIESFSPFLFHIYNFGEQDGMFSKEINDIQLFNDSIFVLAGAKIYSFHKSFSGTSTVPKIKILGLFTNTDQERKEKPLTFEHDKNQLILKYLGLYYPDPDGLTYHYSLDNGETWQQTKERSITVLNLSPGTYSIIINAVSAGGQSSNTEMINFTIFPPFWKTWWFITCSVIFLIIIGYALISHYIGRIRRMNKLENELYKLENKALASQMNPHFIFNAMNSIQHYILKKDKYEAYNYLGRFAKLMRSVLSNSEKESNLMRDEINQLSSYLKLEQIRFEHSFDFEITVDDEIDIDQVSIPGMLIQPFAENSIRHGFAHEKGDYKLEIDFSVKKNSLEVTIKDNGIGRVKAKEYSRESEHQSMGISINKRRLELMKTLNKQELFIRIEDLYNHNVPDGTKVTILIPLKNE